MKKIYDNETFYSAAGAFLVVPLYAIMMLIFLFDLTSAYYNWIPKNVLRYIATPVVIILVGFSVKAWQSIFWLKQNPYKAVAVGRFIFLFYIIISVFFNLILDWPSDTISASLNDAQQQILNKGYDAWGYPTNQTSVYIIEVQNASINKVGFWNFIGFLFDTAINIIKLSVIYIAIISIYKTLKANRKDFDIENFIHEISFGKWGIEYTEWEQNDNLENK